MESRQDTAVELFFQGYNCAQSVFAAYADCYGIDRELALKLAASFGAGMGRMREICGAFSGILLVAGLETGTTVGRDAAGKKANYETVQKLAAIYRERNGSIYCKELLGLVPRENEKEGQQLSGGQQNVEQSAEKNNENGGTLFTDATPEERTAEYYKKRPCPEIIRQACVIIEEEFWKESKSE